MRGGGGGTYGIVTSTTYKTYETVSLTRASITIEFSSPEIAQDVTTEYIKLQSTLCDAGWSASIILSKSSLSGYLLAPSVPWKESSAAFFSFVRYTEQAGGRLYLTLTPFDSFYEFFLATLDNDSSTVTGNQIELASRLLPRSGFENDPAQVANVLLSVGISAVTQVNESSFNCS